MLTVTSTFAGMLAVGYLPVLLAWGRWAHRLGRWERTRGPLSVALAALAIPAALAAVVANMSIVPPFGARGSQLALIAGAVFVGTWLALLLPRLLIRSLHPGAFVADAAA